MPSIARFWANTGYAMFYKTAYLMKDLETMTTCVRLVAAGSAIGMGLKRELKGA